MRFNLGDIASYNGFEALIKGRAITVSLTDSGSVKLGEEYALSYCAGYRWVEADQLESDQTSANVTLGTTYSAGQVVKIKRTGERGLVIAAVEFSSSSPYYVIEYELKGEASSEIIKARVFDRDIQLDNLTSGETVRPIIAAVSHA